MFVLANISAVAAEKAKTEPKRPSDLQMQRHELGAYTGLGCWWIPRSDLG